MIFKRMTIAMTLTVLTVAVTSISAQEVRNAQSSTSDCCKLHHPPNCPEVKPFRRDACVTIQISPINKQDAGFTYNGTHSFMNIFAAGVARGVENATIRAMNAVKVCPSCKHKHEGECDPKKSEANPQPATPAANPTPPA